MGLYDSLIPGNSAAAAPSAPASYGIYGSLVPTNPSPVPGAMNFPVSTPSQSAAFTKAAAPPSDYVAGTPETFAPISSTIKAFSDAITQGGNNLSDQFDQIFSNHTDALQKGTAVGEAAVGTINSIFGALLSPLQGLATVPGVGHLVDFTNTIFGAIGQGSSTVATDVLNKAPISQQTKDTLHPLVSDAAALAGQIIAGHFAGGVLGDLKDKSTAVLTAVDSQLKDSVSTVPESETAGKVAPAVEQAPPETPPAVPESPVAPEAVPGIPNDVAAKENAPTESPAPQEETVTPAQPALALPPPEAKAALPEGTPIVPPETPASSVQVSTPEGRAQAINTPVETGNQRVMSKSVTIDNMQEHLSPADFQQFKEDTSHAKVQRLQQVQAAQSFVHENPAVAEDIIFKRAHPPEGIRTQDVFTEARIQALADYRAGKIPLDQYMRVVKADELLGSRHASELGARANRFESNDPAAWLAKARETLQKSNIKYEENAAKSGRAVKSPIQVENGKAVETVSKARAKLVDYQKVLDAITC